MPRHINPPKSINEMGGLKVYLDTTADKHNGLTYRDFVNRIRPDRKHPPSKVSSAEDFGVSVKTFYDWIRRYNTEQGAISQTN